MKRAIFICIAIMTALAFMATPALAASQYIPDLRVGTIAGMTDFQLNDDGTLTFGTGDDITLDYDGSGDDLDILFDDKEISFGADAAGGDVIFHTENTGDNVTIDEDNAEILCTDVDIQMDDDANIIFGTGDDITFNYDGSGDDLDITGTGLEIAIGADDEGMDVYWHTENTGDNVFFDETNAEVLFTDVDVQLDDAATLIFGSDGDWTMYSDTADTLEIDPGAAGDQLYIGTAFGDACDVTWFSDTDGDTVFFDEEGVQAQFEDVNLQLMDDTTLTFGDADDATIQYDEDGNDYLQVTATSIYLEGKTIMKSATTATTGPTDDYDVSGISILFLNTTSGNVTIGGFTGGVSGQVLKVVKNVAANNATLEYSESTGNQDIFMKSAGDETLTATYGGWTLVCDGTKWISLDED